MNRQTVSKHTNAFNIVAKDWASRNLSVGNLTNEMKKKFCQEVLTVYNLQAESFKILMLSGRATAYGDDKLATAFSEVRK